MLDYSQWIMTHISQFFYHLFNLGDKVIFDVILLGKFNYLLLHLFVFLCDVVDDEIFDAWDKLILATSFLKESQVLILVI